MKKILLIIITSLASLSVFSQTNTVKQDSINKLKGNSLFFPQNLGPNVNTLEHPELNPIISPDGKNLYFSRVNHPQNRWGKHDSQDIWCSDLQPNGQWGLAYRLPDNVNIGKYNSVLSISQDGKTFFLNGQNSKRGHFKRRGFSVSIKAGNDFTDPRKIKIPRYRKINRGISSSAFMSAKSDVIILSFTRKFNGHVLDLYVSTLKDGKWRKPKKLKDVSTRFHSEEAPFLSADGKTLYFSAVHRSGSKGKFDIYKSTRLDDSYRKWSQPVPLSDTINTEDWESYFRTNLKGSWAYFSSNHNVDITAHKKHHHEHADIFVVKLFEENPYALVSGKVINTKTKKPFVSKNFIPVLVDGKSLDSIKYNKDSSSYTLKLPLGKAYSLNPTLKNYIGRQSKIDLIKQKEFLKLKQDLELEPIPYSKIKGNYYQKESINVIPKSSNPKIVINGKVQDSLKINYETGAYSVNLPNGKQYYLEVMADKYVSLPMTVDLTKEETYTEQTQNLYAEPKKPVVLKLSGKVIDRKTNGQVNPSIPVVIQINGIPSTATYYTSSGEYMIELQQGVSYSVNAQVAGYLPVYETVTVPESDKDAVVIRDLFVSPIEVGSSVKINNIFFETGKSVLKQPSFVELDRVVSFLNDNPTIKAEIQGHTDNVGKPDANQKLSAARAKAVTDYLVSKGIDPVRLTSKGYGSTLPVADNKTATGKATNRRVEFKITGK